MFSRVQRQGPDNLEINISLLAHIAADSELQGRFGVQGQVFANTIGYFNQYLNQHPQKMQTLSQLTTSVEQLHQRAKIMQALSDKSAPIAEVNQFCQTTAREIAALGPNQELMIPGGWRNRQSPGHAMIYHFKREKDGVLRFYVYNAGAGVEYHEKVTTPENERYFSTKVYEFPANTSTEQLNHLMERLVHARAPHLRDENWDEEKLYGKSIEEIVPFIIDLTQTKPKLASELFEQTLTTTGQISGTCTQRSIHQMLKHHFPSLEAYQRFILDFKIHAIRDYLTKHTRDGKLRCSPKIHALIHSAIINTLKIANIHDLFPTDEDKKKKISDLYALQDELSTNAEEVAATPQINRRRPTPYSYQLRGRGLYPSSAIQEGDLQLSRPKSKTAFHLQLDGSPLMAQLNDLLKQSQENQALDPLWVMEQIERAMLQLPLPQTLASDPPALYASILADETTADQLRETLEALQDVYHVCRQQTLGNKLLVSQTVVQMSFLTLQDYCLRHRCKVTNQPRFDGFFAGDIYNFFHGNRHSPYLVSHHEAFDQRFMELSALYQGDHDKRVAFSPDYMTYYKALIKGYPDLFDALKGQYTEPSDQELRTLLALKEAQELYVLCEQFDDQGAVIPGSFLNEEVWRPLVALIQKQLAVERLVIKSFSPLYEAPIHGVVKLSLGKKPFYKDELQFNTPLSGAHISSTRLSNHLLEHQYALDESAAKQALMNDHLKQGLWYGPHINKQHTNAIQLSSHDESVGRVISKDDFFIRDLFHLRTSPTHQINSTIDYFQSARHHLVDVNIQRYVEANVFEPGLLRAALRNDVTFIDRFDAFVRSGIKSFVTPNQEITQEALFFIRMSVLVSRYAAECDAQYRDRVPRELERLNDLLATNQDANVLASLHHYRFLTLIALSKQGVVLDEDWFEQALISYFYIQAKGNALVQQDVETRFELQCAQRYFQDLIKTNQISTDSIQHAIVRLNPDFAKLTLLGNYPQWELSNQDKTEQYQIDADLGSVFKDHQKYSPIPLDLYKTSLLKYLGLEQHTSCMLSPNGDVMEFIKPEGNVRIIRHAEQYSYRSQKNKFKIQQEFTKNGEKHWYELQPLNAQQKHQLHLAGDVLRVDALPPVLIDAHTSAWQQCDVYLQAFIMTQAGKPTYYTDDRGQLMTWDQQTFIPAPVPNAFEAEGFTLALESLDSKQIKFERYGLVLQQKQDDFVLSTRPSLVFQPGAILPIMPQVACLLFKETQVDKEVTTEREYWTVPVQPFYRDQEVQPEAGDLYPFKHDTQRHVANELLKKKWMQTPLEEQPLWNYKNTCQSITYAIVDGKPKPEKASNGLYLCYLYLASGQSTLAWEVLEHLQRLPLEGSYEELSYLDWIVNGLPVVLEEDDAEAVRQMPEYGACQLKALSLLSTFLLGDKKPQLPDAASLDLSTANGHYEALRLNAATQLYQNLPDTIYQKLNTYFSTKRHLSHPFFLDEATTQCLLSYYTSRGSEALGALGYQQCASSLASLSQELRLLEANLLHMDAHLKSTQFTPLDRKATERRLQLIQQEVAEQKSVMKRTTVVEKVNVDLSLPAGNVDINHGLLSREARENYWTWVDNLGVVSGAAPAIVMKSLSPNVSQDDFFKYFPDYLKIANNPNDTNRAKLKLFCEKYLIAHRHVPLKKQTTNVPLMVNLLYRTCCLGRPVYLGRLHSLAAELKSIKDLAPIAIYQAKDVFKEMLKDSQGIFETLLAKTPVSQPVMPTPAVVLALAPSQALQAALKSDLLNAFCTQYQTSEATYDAALQTILATLPEHPTFEQLSSAEASAGALQYQTLATQNQVAQQLNDPTLLKDMEQKLGALHRVGQGELEAQWKKTIDFAKKIPSDPSEAHRIEIARRTLQQTKLTEKDLLNLYYHANESDYRERTGLSSEEVQTLHALIHDYAQKKLQVQHIARVQKALEETKKDPNPVQFQGLASTLMSQSFLEAQNDPAIMRFQLEEDMLLRPRQIQAIQHLLSTPDDNRYQFNEWIEKIIMGGGKSKVLLPLIAQKKATGLNLVVVEVPRALLATNYGDLNTTSQKLFHQTAHAFEFDRDSDCSSNRLTVIYNQLLQVMTKRDYLITTGESVQSFRLKYLELLYSRPPESSSEKEKAEWRLQIKMASKIVRLFKERADVVIDEVHDGLLLKKKLNYAFGEPLAISPKVVRLNIALHQFINALIPQPVQALHQEMDEQERIQSNEKALRTGWLELKDKLPDALIDHPNSPLHAYVEQLCGGSRVKKDALVRFLKDEAECPFLAACPDKEMLDAFSFFKAQQKIAALTLSKRYNENYGPSQKAGLSELKKILAIPYIGNGKANERSRFSNQLETMNYTIQSMRLTGITRPMLEEIVQQWLAQARHEVMGSEHKRFLETKVAEGVSAAYLNGTGLTFEQLDVHNPEIMTRLYQALRFNDALIYDVLENQILPQINQERHVLASNAFNHAGIYRSKQGVSGTPSNYNTFHQDLKFNPKTSLGTDGYIQELLKNKNTSVQAVPFTNLKDFLERALTTGVDAEKIRAIMDINATFTGYSNVEVARALVDHYKSHPAAMEYVLYFDKSDRLCALSCLDINAPPMVLNTSDPKEISQKLGGCPPERRFTYYDQSHTVGVDIKQAVDSKGLALVDERTPLQAFLQGAMRMRGLEAGQSLSIIAQNELTLDAHLARMAQNEENQLKDDNFVAAIEKIDHLIYDDLLKRITACDDPEKQATLAETFRAYFIETQQLDLYKQYGSVSKKMRTDEVLHRYAEQAIREWSKLLMQAEIAAMAEDEPHLQRVTRVIIDKALPQCREFVVWHNKQNDDQEYENEKEKHKEEQKQEEQQKQEEFFSPELEEMKAVAWKKEAVECFANNQLEPFAEWARANTFALIKFYPLVDEIPPGSQLSPQIQITSNYMRVYKNQPRMLGYFLKPMHEILFRKNKTTGELTACIVTKEEAEQMTPWLGTQNNVWLSNARQTLLAGHRPPDILKDPVYQTLMEQLCYFGGEMQILTNQQAPLTWLSESPEEKLAYFDEHLMPYRSTRPADVALLKSVFSNAHSGYEYISEHAFDDLTAFDWERQYASLTDQALRSLQTLAAIYKDINQNPPKPIINETVSTYLQRYPSLPPAAVAYLKQHLNTHRWIQMLECLQKGVMGQDLIESAAGLGIDLTELSDARQKDFNLIQLDLLMSCFKSPSYNDALTRMPCMLNNPLFKAIKLQAPITPERVMLAFIQNMPGLTVQGFKQLLKYPKTPATLHALFSHALFEKTSLSAAELSDLLQDCAPHDRDIVLTAIDQMSKTETERLILMTVVFHHFKGADALAINAFMDRVLHQKPLPFELFVALNGYDVPQEALHHALIDAASTAEQKYLDKLLENPRMNAPAYWNRLAQKAKLEYLPVIFDKKSAELPIEALSEMVRRATSADLLKKIAEGSRSNEALLEQIALHKSCSNEVRYALIASKIKSLVLVGKVIDALSAPIDEATLLTSIQNNPHLPVSEKTPLLLARSFVGAEVGLIKSILNNTQKNKEILLKIITDRPLEEVLDVLKDLPAGTMDFETFQKCLSKSTGLDALMGVLVNTLNADNEAERFVPLLEKAIYFAVLDSEDALLRRVDLHQLRVAMAEKVTQEDHCLRVIQVPGPGGVVTPALWAVIQRKWTDNHDLMFEAIHHGGRELLLDLIKSTKNEAWAKAALDQALMNGVDLASVWGALKGSTALSIDDKTRRMLTSIGQGLPISTENLALFLKDVISSKAVEDQIKAYLKQVSPEVLDDLKVKVPRIKAWVELNKAPDKGLVERGVDEVKNTSNKQELEQKEPSIKQSSSDHLSESSGESKEEVTNSLLLNPQFVARKTRSTVDLKPSSNAQKLEQQKRPINQSSSDPISESSGEFKQEVTSSPSLKKQSQNKSPKKSPVAKKPPVVKKSPVVDQPSPDVPSAIGHDESKSGDAVPPVPDPQFFAGLTGTNQSIRPASGVIELRPQASTFQEKTVESPSAASDQSNNGPASVKIDSQVPPVPPAPVNDEADQVSQCVQAFIDHLNALPQDTKVKYLVNQLTQASSEFLRTRYLPTYKATCNQALTSPFTRKMTIIEHISEVFRALCNLLDRFFTKAMGKKQTQADTPGRDAFFKKPDLETDLSKAVVAFKQKLQAIEPSKPNLP
jgi:hypothetical protein